MSKFSKRDLAIRMREKGMSYSQIKEHLQVSKSTLSLWLRHMPLSEQRIRELRDHSEQRIEKTRETKRKKKLQRIRSVYSEAVKDIGKVSKRELYIAGFFLYWGEGVKADPYTTMFTNTDPAMVKCFIQWIALLGVKKSDLKVYLHVYSDMDIPQIITFWSNELNIPQSSFRKPYVKKSVAGKQKNYKGRFGFGTCNIYVRNRDIREKIIMSIARIREVYGGIAFDPEKEI
ncbi:hypothetical protein COU15_02155 [Candidatus Kaiserbacteria bacterium CG10_big_fil_rev_8_21_14_0_10_45_20]|uniref:Uncharacterized protein n=1 Tax=Candidatus Kaiserbacteria bacterium CG10_big_fil_rev_8_21_14_0_10_45_20 TaxID=1974607 RepID=A0A2H0UFL0_9BACT|nr:MAG: hypothetical protein COU15_02155 [Candidatus Kaiserbacteria bacterium CG10_big_fil_rev_8_21_14_0_10_45_20]